MRLIDAEEFKRQIAGMAIVSDYPPRKANALCELIDKQPTAYDVDKVVERLETTRWCDHIEDWLDIDEITSAVVKVVKDGEMK